MKGNLQMDAPVLDPSSKPATRTMPAITLLVVVICWFSMLADGYDLGIYGAVLPSLMEYKDWSLSPAKAGAIGSYALVGMLVGAICVGTVTDMIGRKKTLAFCVSLFSIMMGFAAMAPSPDMFGLFRFLGGIALGGVIPTASALTIEYSPVERRSLMYAVMYTGYPVGGLLGALLSMYFLQDFGWRFLFWLGAVPILLVPFILTYLPESISFLLAKNRREEAEQIAARYNIPLDTIGAYQPDQANEGKGKFASVAALFAKQNIRATICFWIAFFMGLLMIYGLSTWLPKMMKEAGYPLGSSLGFLFMLNLSAAVGALLAGRAADRWGSQKIISISYLLAGVSMALLSVKSSMPVVYALVGLAGFGTIGTTLIMNAYISKYFSADNRATALGWAIGFGRIGAISGPVLIGLFMSWNMGPSWNFYTFAIAGIIASVMVLFIPKHRDGNI
ncbi:MULTISPECIES: aromatic acid/H+ symport family MFS transporter [Brevibacillus]|uniref:MFS transporter n=1 Tax=Brevibacillus aydinogluensis TaxID=927786 RepID=A0AA48M9L9_9BACL|nr:MULTISPECIES: aromatic acid/H+ symport family MFS transporter [Brevibacillus]CAJ1002136.1 MFS transporter [Brevibacillus aydinogluensis]